MDSFAHVASIHPPGPLRFDCLRGASTPSYRLESLCFLGTHIRSCSRAPILAELVGYSHVTAFVHSSSVHPPKSTVSDSFCQAPTYTVPFTASVLIPRYLDKRFTSMTIKCLASEYTVWHGDIWLMRRASIRLVHSIDLVFVGHPHHTLHHHILHGISFIHGISSP